MAQAAESRLIIRLTHFRAKGITNFLENDGTLEASQRIAGQADSWTTKAYDRRGQKVFLRINVFLRTSSVTPVLCIYCSLGWTSQ
jgi:hypothetical protein